MKKIVTLTALGLVLATANANAAGFNLREQSAAAQGNAFAGATAGAENISYTYFNVAGLTRHRGTQMNLGASYIAPEASAKNVYEVNNDGSLGQRGSDIHTHTPRAGCGRLQTNRDWRPHLLPAYNRWL